jgi:Calcineurin-like phosphoesterase
VRDGYPTLLEKLAENLTQPDPKCPVAVCITGDLAETGDPKEFGDAELFLRGLASTTVFGNPRPLRDLFVVPGNHDVVYTGGSPRERLTGFAQLLGSVTGSFMDAADPWRWPILHDRIDEHGLLIVTLNSSIHVQKGKPDEERGHMDTNN